MDNNPTRKRDQVRKRRVERWREENRKAIESYNDYIKKHGLWHKGFTPWH